MDTDEKILVELFGIRQSVEIGCRKALSMALRLFGRNASPGSGQGGLGGISLTEDEDGWTRIARCAPRIPRYRVRRKYRKKTR